MMELYRLEEDDILSHYVILGHSKYCFNHLIKTSTLKEIVLRRSDNIYKHLNTGGCYRAIKSDPLLFCVALLYLDNDEEKNHGKKICNSINKTCHIPTDLFKFMNLLTHANNLESNCQSLDVNEFYGLFVSNAFKSEEDSVVRNRQMNKFVVKHKFIENWYSDPKKHADRLLYVMTKYKSRCSWDHVKILRAGHFIFPGGEKENVNDRGDCNLVINYILHGFERLKRNDKYQKYNEYFEGGKPPNGIAEIDSRVIEAINIIEKSKMKNNVSLEAHVEVVVQLIKKIARQFDTRTYAIPNYGEVEAECFGLLKFHVCVEHLSTKLHNQVQVWQALMLDMPIIAMFRHICYIAYLGLFNDEESEKNVTKIITDQKRLRCVHPLQILKTIISYKAGETMHGSHSWTVNTNVYEALLKAFRISFEWEFGRVMSQKKYKICVEASTRLMCNNYVGFSVLSGAKYALALAFALQQFSHGATVCVCREDVEMVEDNDLYDMMGRIPLMTTEVPDSEVDDTCQSDLSKPIMEALFKKEKVDAFVLFTTSIKTSLVGGSPYDAFCNYRKDMGINAKLIICAMEVTELIIADPRDENVKVICGGDKYLIKNIIQFMKE